MPQPRPSSQATTPARLGPRETLARELATLKRKREETEEKLSAAKSKLLETQQTLSQDDGQLGELTNSIGAFERLVKDLEASRSAITAQQQAAQAELNLVRRSVEQILGQIDAKLPQARRRIVQQAIDEAGGALEEGKRKVEALRQRVTEAETALAEAREWISGHEAGSREAMTQLRALPGKIQAARGNVAKLNAAAQAAAAAGRMAEAFYLVEELRRALTSLGDFGESSMGKELCDRVAEQWLEARAAKAELSGRAGKTPELDQHKRELATAQGELQQQAREREGRIRSALATSESAAEAVVSGTAQPSAAARKGRVPGRSDG